MKVMLDTDICIYAIKQKPDAVVARFQAYEIGDIGVSTVTVAELFYGAEKSTKPTENRRIVERFLTPIEIVPFDYRAATVYGKIRSDLAKSGTPIGPLDTMIAAHALDLGVVLATNNTKEFTRVSGLAVENWAIP